MSCRRGLSLPELQPPPNDHLHQQVVGRPGHSDAGPEVEFPIGAQVQVESRHDGLLLVAHPIKARDRTDAP